MEHVTAAYFYKSSKGAYLRIESLLNGRRATLAEIPVSGKREARAEASKHGATPWNF